MSATLDKTKIVNVIVRASRSSRPVKCAIANAPIRTAVTLHPRDRLTATSFRLKSVELTGRSGSQWLDLGAQAVFRGATVPPFPPSTPENQANLDLTIRYYLYRR